MTRRARTLAATAALLLAHCATVYGQVVNVFAQPSDRVVNPSPYAAQLYPIDEADPVRSVARQAALGGNVVLWPGTWPMAAATFATAVVEAAKYPGTFTHVYFVTTHGDEIFWCATHVCIGENEDTLIAAAHYAHAHGLKTICTMLPDVVLDAGFRMRDQAMCDGIALDIYPAIRPTQPDVSACWVADNVTANLLNCSVKKLRAMGYRGDLGLLYQAFCLRTDSLAKCKAQLLAQRDVLDNLDDYGVGFSAPWGLYLGATEQAREPNIMPLGGTRLERLVRP